MMLKVLILYDTRREIRINRGCVYKPQTKSISQSRSNTQHGNCYCNVIYAQKVSSVGYTLEHAKL